MKPLREDRRSPSPGAADWSISRSWAIAPPTGAGYDAAYVVRLTDRTSASTHDLVVEYAAPSAVPSVGYAEEIARRFLRQNELPAHVVVDIQRAVRVVAERSGEPGAVAEGR